MNTDLIARLEAATSDERGLFEEAYKTVFGKSAQWESWYAERSEDRLRGTNYQRKLDAQAWESAVRMLLPERCWVRFDSWPPDIGKEAVVTVCPLLNEDGNETFTSSAHTEANAFAAACLKAQEARNG